MYSYYSMVTSYKATHVLNNVLKSCKYKKYTSLNNVLFDFLPYLK